MLAFTIFWAYIAYFQFFLIWIANIPEEAPWYVLRMNGTWTPVSLAVLFGHFIVPFFFLLPRNIKMRPRALMTIALWILGMHFVDLYWMTMPLFHPEGPAFHWTTPEKPEPL